MTSTANPSSTSTTERPSSAPASRHRHLLAATAGAALALGAAWPAAAADLPDPTSTKDGAATTITVVLGEQETTYTPKGGKPGPFPEEENFVPKVGDSVTDTADLTQDGTKVGTDVGVCTVTKVVRTAVTFDCDTTDTFAPGTLKVNAVGTVDVGPDAKEEEETTHDSIVGGTGAYQGATGTSELTTTVVDKAKDTVTNEITFTFTTGRGGQVSRTPAGGSQSGATREVGGVDAGLIGLGTAALGGGAALLAARSRVIRRVR